MFRIDIRNLVKNKVGLAKEYHIQPSEINRMVFFEYEYMLEEINVLQKQQEEQNASQQKEYDSMRKGMNPQSMMPKMPNVTMPKVSMPSITMPKL